MSLGDKDFIVPEEPLEQQRFKQWLIAIARSLKKKQQQLQADQDLLNDRWTNVMAAEEYDLVRPTKSYPKHKLLPLFNEEASEPVPATHNAAERPPCGRYKTATQAEHRPILSRCKGRDTTAEGHTYDLRQDLKNKLGPARPIYGSRGRALRRDDGYQAKHDKHNHARAESRRRTPSELRHDLA